MDTTQATIIITALADGIDPATGEVLPPSHILQQGDTARALQVALAAMQNPTRKRRRRRATSGEEGPPSAQSAYANHGAPWTDDDDKTLVAMFNAGTADAEIAAHFGRSPNSIRSRLLKLRLLTLPTP